MTGRPRVSFDEVQQALTIQMIATPRGELVTCSYDESVVDAYEKAEGLFDHLPVEEDGVIAGIFKVQAPTSSSAEQFVRHHMVPQPENHLITADAKICDYLLQDPAPRLLVSNLDRRERVLGLVTPADTRRAAAQAALACLIFEFEVALVHRIEEQWPDPDEGWMRRLDKNPRKRIRRWHREAKKENRDVGLLLESSLTDKMKILRVSADDADLIGRLRNDIFHVKEAARAPELSIAPEVVFRSARALARVRARVRGL